MKYLLIALLLTIVNACVFTAASAQNMAAEPYWVIENNVKTPKQSMVYFYSADHQLMYKEQVTGKKLNVRRKKIVSGLNAVLHEASLVWQKENKPKENEQLIAKRF